MNKTSPNNKILFINPLYSFPGMNAAGIANLRGYLAGNNIKSSVIDFNQYFLRDKLFNPGAKNNHLLDLLESYKKYLCNQFPSQTIKKFNIDKLKPFALSSSVIQFYTIANRDDHLIKIAEKCKIFQPVFRELFPKNFKIKYIGISITYSHQLLFSLILAHFLKKTMGKKIKIVVGGAFVTYNTDGLKTFLKNWPIFDYLIIGEGQTALHNLIAGETKSSIPNLIYYDGHKYNNSKNLNFYEDFLSLPAPLYEPYDIPCLQISRKCYWDKCVYCNNYDATFRNKTPDHTYTKKAINDLRVIQAQIKTKNPLYYFLDSAIPPKILKLFSEEIIKDKTLPRKYRNFLRCDPGLDLSTLKLAKEAGFGRTREHRLEENAKLVFGLETSSDRLLKTMGKGVIMKNAEKVFNNCIKLKLNMQINFIYSLPTQTKDDLMGDLYFIKKIINKYPYPELLKINFMPYVLLYGTYVYNNPSKYCIDISIKEKPLFSRGIPFTHTKKNIITRNSALNIIQSFINEHKINHNFINISSISDDRLRPMVN